MSLAYSPALAADEPLLLALYASTREAELAQVPWPDGQKQAFLQMQFTAQTQHYTAQYPQSDHLVIRWEGAPVGRLWVDRGPDRIHILDLTILPGHRSHGIGRAVLAGLMAAGAESGRPVSIYVESWSPAMRLFARLGFAKVSEHGYQHLLRWSPAPDQHPSEAERGMAHE